MNQGEDRISGLEFKVEELDHSSKEHDKNNNKKNTWKVYAENLGHQKKKKEQTWTTGTDEGEES